MIPEFPDYVCEIFKFANSMYFKLEDGFKVLAGSGAAYDALIKYGFYNEQTNTIDTDTKDRFYILRDKIFKFHELRKILEQNEDHLYSE